MDSLILNKLNIMIWNSQSIKPKLNEFSNFLSSHKIDLALLSESWLNPSIKFHVPGFKIYRNDRVSNSSRPHGGVAICIRENILHSKVKVVKLQHIENLFIEIPFQNSILSVGVLYCPPSMLVRDFRADMGKLLSVQGPVIMGGDINAKHVSWNNTNNNYKGVELVRLTDSSFFDVLSPDSPTLYPAVGSPSTVDLVIKKGINCLSNLRTINDLSSDHLPVIFHISSKFVSNDNKIFDFSKADWPKYRNIIEDGISINESHIPQNNSRQSIDSNIDFLTNLIKTATDSSIPKKNPQIFRYPHSDKISLLKKNRNYYRKMYKSTLNPAFRSCTNQLNKLISAETSKLARDSWDAKLSKIDHRDNSVYHLARNLKRKHSEMPPLRIDSDTLAYTDEGKTQLLAKQFFDVHDRAFNLSSTNQRKVNKCIRKLNSKTIDTSNIKQIDLSVVKLHLINLKTRKAPGADKISNLLLKNLPEMALSFMIDIFNGCLKVSYFPSVWKLGRIVALPKPNKDSSIASNYRPITLLSCMGKLFERLILSQIKQFLNSNKILINQQFGFRSGHSTSHQILRIIESISMDFNRDISSGMVCLDVEKAFDSVWHDGLIFKMSQLNFPTHILKIVQSFLNDRESFVQIRNAKSPNFRVIAGVPQGSILSPTLFNIYLNDIPTPAGCVKAIYADDTAIKASGGRHEIKSIIQRLQDGLVVLNKFFAEWKIKLNCEKTEAIMFSHSIIINREKESHKILFNGQYLEWKNQIKYLGLILDSKLLFKANTQNSLNKTRKAISVLYPLLKKQSSVNFKTKLLLFKLYLLPILSYGCPVWANMSNCHFKKLQIQQNKILRMVLSAPYRTKIESLHEKSKVIYFKERIENLTSKFYDRLNNLNIQNPLVRKLGKYSRESIPFRVKHKLPKKV